MNKHTAHVSTEKKKSVDEFAKLLVEYPIIGIINVETLPSKQLQAMRGKLRKGVIMKMTKRRLLQRAVEKIKDKKPGIEKLMNYAGGMPVLIFTKENPFKLQKTIQKNKSKSPIKPGQKAPFDIIIQKGPTPFTPGPVISELATLKIKAGVVAGKIEIKEDAVVLKKDEVCSGPLSSMLMRLSIEPMEIGLNVVAMYENGMVYTKDVLSIDDEKLKADLAQAHTWALNLAVEAKIVNKTTIEIMLMNAQKDAIALQSITQSKPEQSGGEQQS